MKGLFFDEQIGEVIPDATLPSMPCVVATDPSLMQAFASTYTMDSLFQAGLSVQPLGGWYNSTTVTTDTLSTLLPGIVTAYGSVPVDIHFKLEAVTDISVTASN